MSSCRFLCKLLIFLLLHGFVLADVVVIGNIALYKSTESVFIDEGIITVKPKETFKILIFGLNINSTLISFTSAKKARGENCDDDRFTNPIRIYSDDGKVATLSQSFDVSICYQL